MGRYTSKNVILPEKFTLLKLQYIHGILVQKKKKKKDRSTQPHREERERDDTSRATIFDRRCTNKCDRTLDFNFFFYLGRQIIPVQVSGLI